MVTFELILLFGHFFVAIFVGAAKLLWGGLVAFWRGLWYVAGLIENLLYYVGRKIRTLFRCTKLHLEFRKLVKETVTRNS